MYSENFKQMIGKIRSSIGTLAGPFMGRLRWKKIEAASPQGEGGALVCAKISVFLGKKNPGFYCQICAFFQ